MISALRLYNFKAFADQMIEMRPLTLLAGLNGMGKSTILQALLLLRQSHLRGILNEGLALNGDLAQIGSAPDAKYEAAGIDDDIRIEIEFAGGRGAYWQFNYTPSSEENEALERDGRRRRIEQIDVIPLLDAVDETSDGVENTALFTDRFHYLQAERVGPRTSFPMSDYAVRHRQIGPRGEYAVHFLGRYGNASVLQELHHPATQGNKDANTLFAQVTAWMREISPGIRLNIETYPEADIARLGYSIEIGQEIPPTSERRATNYGFGVTYSLSVLVAFLSSQQDGLVLLENPEAHLHPRGQSKIGELAARAAQAGVQIILETHSDHVLNGIRIAARTGLIDARSVALHFFQRAGDGTSNTEIVSPRLNQEGRLDFWPEGFFDEWDNSLDALM